MDFESTKTVWLKLMGLWPPRESVLPCLRARRIAGGAKRVGGSGSQLAPFAAVTSTVIEEWLQRRPLLVASFPRFFQIHRTVGEKAGALRKVITIGFEVGAIVECAKSVSHPINNHRFPIPSSERPSRGCAEGWPLWLSGCEKGCRCHDDSDEWEEAQDSVLPYRKFHTTTIGN
jgi:hypothetical protein